MSTGNWRCIIAAIGLILATSSGQTQEQAQTGDRSAERNEQPAQTLPLPLPIEIVEDQSATKARESREAESRQREIDDLLAQQGMNTATQSMNDATQKMAFHSQVSMVLVGIGTFLLVITLWLTRGANKAAVLMVESQRAWISFEKKLINDKEVPAPILLKVITRLKFPIKKPF